MHVVNLELILQGWLSNNRTKCAAVWALDQSETYNSTEHSGLGNEGRLVKCVKPGDALA